MTESIDIRNDAVVLENSRSLQETENICTDTTSLLTSFRSDMQAYGVMFTINSKHTPLTILTLEFSAMITRNDDPVHIEVYTKEGDYSGYQAVPNAWSKVADLRLLPARTGRGTLIPPQDFTPVLMGANEQRAFYVTLDSTSLRYTGAPAIKAGQPYVEDEALQINVGGGLLEYPFSTNLFEPRLFNGAFHYRRHVPCNDGPSVTTVPFQLLVEYEGNTDLVLSRIDSAIRSTLRTILENDAKLMAGIAFRESTTSIAEPHGNTEAITDCRTTTTKQCDPIVSNIELQYNPTIMTEGTVMYALLNARSDIVLAIDTALTDSINVLYLGAIPVESEIIMTMDGIPNGQVMDDNIENYFEEVVKDLLAERLVSSFQVLDVAVNTQTLLTPSVSGSQNRARRQLQFKPQTKLDIDTKILGMYRPPPFVNFEQSILNAMKQDQGRYFQSEIQARRNRPEYPLTDQERLYFDTLTSIKSRSATVPEEPETEPADRSSIVPILLLVLVVLIGLMIGLYVLMRISKRRKQKKSAKTEMEKSKNVAAVDDYMSRMYDQAFGTFKAEPEEQIQDPNIQQEILQAQREEKQQQQRERPDGYRGVQFHPSVTERQRYRLTQQAPPARKRPSGRPPLRNVDRSTMSFSATSGSRDEDIDTVPDSRRMT